MLQLFGGDIVHLPVPKSFCKQDIEFHEALLFFATADAQVVLAIGGVYLSIKFRNDVSSLEVFFSFWKQMQWKIRSALYHVVVASLE